VAVERERGAYGGESGGRGGRGQHRRGAGSDPPTTHPSAGRMQGRHVSKPVFLSLEARMPYRVLHAFGTAPNMLMMELSLHKDAAG
jgi:hypothetical protein